MFTTDSVLLYYCPLCDQRVVRQHLSIYVPELELRIWTRSSEETEDLARDPLPSVYRDPYNAATQALTPCDHLLLIRVHASLHQQERESHRLIGRYSAKWDHPHFQELEDQRYAAELKLRLASGNPRGEGVWNHADSGFRHQYHDETLESGMNWTIDRVLNLQIDAMFAMNPSGFVDEYARFVRGFVCPCRSRVPATELPDVK